MLIFYVVSGTKSYGKHKCAILQKICVQAEIITYALSCSLSSFFSSFFVFHSLQTCMHTHMHAHAACKLTHTHHSPSLDFWAMMLPWWCSDSAIRLIPPLLFSSVMVSLICQSFDLCQPVNCHTITTLIQPFWHTKANHMPQKYDAPVMCLILPEEVVGLFLFPVND